MKTFVASRLGSMVAILVALTAVMFVLQNISPLDPVKAQLGAQASADAVAARRGLRLAVRCGVREIDSPRWLTRMASRLVGLEAMYHARGLKDRLFS